MTKDLLLLIGLTLVPWVELRGAIPLGIAMGYHPLWIMTVAVVANCALIVPTFAALDLLYARWFSRWAFLRRQLERVRVSGGAYLDRYGLPGLALFVAVPLPGTGAYSGTLLAWVMGVRRRSAVVAIAAGVLGAGLMVTLAATGVITLIQRAR